MLDCLPGSSHCFGASDASTAEGTDSPETLALASRFANIDGGYKLVDTDNQGYGIYFDEEDEKFLFFRESRWCVADDRGDPIDECYCTSNRTKSKDPSSAKWGDGLRITVVDLEQSQRDVFDVNSCIDERFVDPDFPPTSAALGQGACECMWVRGAALKGQHVTPKLFDKIEPTDVCQGALGNCWLLAAISACAEFPAFFEDEVFVTKKFDPSGRYVLRLYDCYKQSFVEVEVDSLIPCRPRQWWETTARPLFAQPHGNELYILLVEKAMAKFAGSFSALDGGFVNLAWMVLTGCEKQYYWTRESDGVWTKALVRLDQRRRSFAKSRDFSDLDLQEPGAEEQPATAQDDDFFQVLKEYDESNFVMAARIDGDEIEKARDDGLVERHAYSLLSAVQAAADVRLVELRNPWGNEIEWNGDWSDKSKLWKRRKDVAKAVGFDGVGEDDGRFWMAYEDFAETFTAVEVSARSMPTKRGEHAVHAIRIADQRQAARARSAVFQTATAAAGAVAVAVAAAAAVALS